MDTRAQLLQWVTKYAAAAATLESRAQKSQRALWASFDAWYTAELVNEIAQESADLTGAARIHIGGLAEHYVATVVAALRDGPVNIVNLPAPPARFGADMIQVYTRVAEQYRFDRSKGAEADPAKADAMRRLDGLTESDVRTAARDYSQGQMLALKTKHFRRVLRPELAKSGSCGLCIAASTRIYSTGDLMPMHPACHCVPMPIIDGQDAAHTFNQQDLDRIYKDAGTTKAEDLRTTRYSIGDHGELGPVLYARGTNFRTAADVPGYDAAVVPADRRQTALEALEKAQAKFPLPWNTTRIEQLREALAA